MKVIGGFILVGVASADFTYTVVVNGDGCEASACTGPYTDPAAVDTCLNGLAQECGWDITATLVGDTAKPLTVDKDVCTTGAPGVQVFKFPKELLDHGLTLPAEAVLTLKEAQTFKIAFDGITTACPAVESFTTLDSPPTDGDCSGSGKFTQEEPTDATKFSFNVPATDAFSWDQASLSKYAKYLVFNVPESCAGFEGLKPSSTGHTIASYVLTVSLPATPAPVNSSTDASDADTTSPVDSSDTTVGSVNPPDTTVGSVNPPDSTLVAVSPSDSTISPKGSSTTIVAGNTNTDPGNNNTEGVGAKAGLTAVSVLIAIACLQ